MTHKSSNSDAEAAGGVQADGRRDAVSASPGKTGRDRNSDSMMRDSLMVTRVDGMHCHKCEERIVRSVTALPGVREVEVDFASGQASIIFDSRKVSAHQVIGAIEEAGYRCEDSALGNNGGAVE